MKLVRRLANSLALLIMTLFVLLLPLSLLINSASRMILSPGIMADMLKTNLINSEVLAGIAEQSMQNRDPFVSENPLQQIVQEALQRMDHEDWVELFDLVAPPEILEQITLTFVQGFSDWISEASEENDLTIDLQPLKMNIVSQAIPVAHLILGTLPQCSNEQMLQYAMMALGLSQETPICIPPEPFFSLLLEIGNQFFPGALEILPNNIDIGILITDRSGGQKVITRGELQKWQKIAHDAWMGALLLYGIAIVMGTTSAKGFFRWAGLPMVLAGVTAAIISYFFRESSQKVAEMIASRLHIEAPALILQGMQNVFAQMVVYLSQPMARYALLMSATGVLFLLVSLLFSRRGELKYMNDEQTSEKKREKKDNEL